MGILYPEDEDDVPRLNSIGGAMTEEKKAGQLRRRPTPTTPMMEPIGRIPPGWVGNYSKIHDPGNDLCGCSRCTMREYPHLQDGPPAQVHPAYPVDCPQMQNVVGLYDKRVMNTVRVECSKCRGYIELKGFIADTFAYTPEKQDVCHFGCLPDDERKHLESIGYNLPYIILIKRVDGGGGNGSVPETLPKEE